MQRYHAANAINNSGVSARDMPRSESSMLPNNFSLNSRRPVPLIPYKLRCEKESLNPRLGPPDFNPPALNCPEETLTRENVQSGYKETVEMLEESKELTLTQVQTFSKPVIHKCKESIRKCHRAINESRAQKRKAGQVYGVPLGGTLLSKSCGFPEQKPCGEEFRKKWIEGLSQPHKRLRSLAEQVPHGYKKKALFEVLIRNKVPLLRASWFIKVTYLNQIRPSSPSISSAIPDKTRLLRSEQWTKDLIEYLQYLLDEVVSRNNSYSSSLNVRDRSAQTGYSVSMQHKSDAVASLGEGEEASVYYKWWYIVRVLQWHHSEGLLLPYLVVDWVLNQLQSQDKELFGILQLLLPIIYGLLETLVLSQTYVRSLVGIAVRFIREPSPGGSDLVDNSRREYTLSALSEMLRYLILAVPDTFVGLDCFPLPQRVLSHAVNDAGFLSKRSDNKSDGSDARSRNLSVERVVSSVQKCSVNLARAARPCNPGHNVAKAVQEMDKALLKGDVRVPYKFLFENLNGAPVDERWMSEVSPCLRSSLKWIGTVSLSLVSSVFLVCEWATCDFRDFRTGRPHGLKFSGRRDFSQVYVAIRLLKMAMKNVQSSVKLKNLDTSDIFQSPGPLHDVIVCWIDQHELQNEEGFKRLQLLVIELTRSGVFYPPAYLRQLIVSGIMDKMGPAADLERCKRHYKILKQLSASFIMNALEEARVTDVSVLSEAVHVYSNERRLILRGLLDNRKIGNILNNIKKRKSYLNFKNSNRDVLLEDLKASISFLLQIPNSSTTSSDTGPEDNKKLIGLKGSKPDIIEPTPGCEECRKAKRQKLGDERSAFLTVGLQGMSSTNIVDDEELWWVKKGANNKPLEPFRADPPPPLKPPKQAPRGRQKNRKSASLAQLAAARIEGSHGASTSHVCDNRVNCPHHRTTSSDGDAPKSTDVIKSDIVSIGKSLKQLQFGEQRAITAWLIGMVRNLVEDTERNIAKNNNNNSNSPYGRTFPGPAVEDRGLVQWKLGEDELNNIMYLMDICNDLVSGARFLLWLLPRVPCSPSSTIQSGRSILTLPRNVENHACAVGEAFLLASLRRYENILAATDLVPEALSSVMHRTTTIMTSNSRISGSAALVYARHLLKKYSDLESVAEWEKNSKSTYDKRLTSELDSSRPSDGDLGFPLGVPAGIEDLDEFLRQKISGVRLSRAGMNMREIVQRHIDEAVHQFYGKERKPFAPQISVKTPNLENHHQTAQQIVMGLMECMRQTGGAAQEGDPTLVSSAVSSIINNMAKVPDLSDTANNSPLSFAKHVLKVHISCLLLLKEALGERQSRVFEIALATEASSAVAQAFSPSKPPRGGQFQLSLENPANESAKSRTTAAVSALVIGSILHGVATLDRMVTVFRLKENLDIIQFLRGGRSNSNGNIRSIAAFKVDNNLIEVSLHWFRVLVGNCRSVSDGLIVDLLGESSIISLFRMQRLLPLNLIFPPAYAIFAFVVWRPFILNSSIGTREDINQLNHMLSLAVSDAIKHLPFRDVCLRDTRGLYDIVTADPTDAEFAAMIELNGTDMHSKSLAFVPLRARLFLNAIIDCQIPIQDESNRKVQNTENEAKIRDKIHHVLDMLQAAKFHWQWVELRLLLDEQALLDKLKAHDISLAESIRAISASQDKAAALDNENNFILIVLTRLLVRPDAAPLFAEVVHLFGRSLEDSMLLQAKWLLGGHDVLFGRKSIRSKLNNIADSRGLPTKPQFSRPWGWCYSNFDIKTEKVDKNRQEVITSLEEGEVVEDSSFDSKRYGRGGLGPTKDLEVEIITKQHVTERALIELLLPCIDQCSDDSRNTFASDLVKQMNNIEQQISAVTCGASNKQAGIIAEAPVTKGSNRKGLRGGGTGLARRQVGPTETVPPSPAALRASMSLRLQFVLRLLPIIWTDREPTARNMRHLLASVMLRLLGSRVVHEDADQPLNPRLSFSLKKEVESLSSVDLSAESLFQLLLLVLHVLLSCTQPAWLKTSSSSSSSKPALEFRKEFTLFDRDVAENLQNELDRMQLPETIRWRIQTAMPFLFPSVRFSVSCQMPSLPPTALSSLQPSILISPLNLNPPQRTSVPLTRSNGLGKSKASLLQKDHLENKSKQDLDMEVDPWTLLEDGAGSGQSSSNSAVMSGGDSANLKASSWLKGAVRVRRMDLTYIGAVDEDG
jgi:hypothetical protein